MSKSLNRVAIIDDNVSLCGALGRALSQVDFEAVEYHSAEAFISDPSKANFCCLLVDIQLSGMSGLEMHRRLLESGDRTPVVFMTALNYPALRARAIESGAGLFYKMDPLAKLIDAIRQVRCAAGGSGN
jgi:FixJ family two-component response regulator